MTGRLHDRWDKRKAMVWGAVLLGVFPAVPLTIGVLGWAPSLESGWLMPMLMLFGALAAAAGSVLAISVLSALADIADENELRHGLRQEGVLYSTRAVFAKLDAALGTFLVGVVLDLVGMPEKAVPGQVPQSILNQIALIDGPLLIIPAVIGAYFYSRYGIDRQGHARIKADLADARARRASASEAPLDVPVAV
jgi:Na+/melibiose symporter-like transporter